MRRLKKILLGMFIVLVLIQFIQAPHNDSSEILSTDLAETVNVPGNVQNILKAGCYDCHSNTTNYPWYSRIQPFGWLLEKHIRKIERGT